MWTRRPQTIRARPKHRRIWSESVTNKTVSSPETLFFVRIKLVRVSVAKVSITTTDHGSIMANVSPRFSTPVSTTFAPGYCLDSIAVFTDRFGLPPS